MRHRSPTTYLFSLFPLAVVLAGASSTAGLGLLAIIGLLYSAGASSRNGARAGGAVALQPRVCPVDRLRDLHYGLPEASDQPA